MVLCYNATMKKHISQHLNLDKAVRGTVEGKSFVDPAMIAIQHGLGGG